MHLTCKDTYSKQKMSFFYLKNRPIFCCFHDDDTKEFARVVELVDTVDLKSIDHCDRAGSSPAPGTTSKSLY